MSGAATPRGQSKFVRRDKAGAGLEIGTEAFRGERKAAFAAMRAALLAHDVGAMGDAATAFDALTAKNHPVQPATLVPQREGRAIEHRRGEHQAANEAFRLANPKFLASYLALLDHLGAALLDPAVQRNPKTSELANALLHWLWNPSRAEMAADPTAALSGVAEKIRAELFAEQREQKRRELEKARAALRAATDDQRMTARAAAAQLRAANAALSRKDVARRLAPEFAVSARTIERWLAD
jgi:hypothetical protein